MRHPRLFLPFDGRNLAPVKDHAHHLVALKRVVAHRHSAGSSIHVIARQRALPALIERSARGECQRMRGKDMSLEEMAPEIQKLPSRCSNFVAFPRSVPPAILPVASFTVSADPNALST